MCENFKKDIINKYLNECNHYKKEYEKLDLFIRWHNLRCSDCDVLINWKFFNDKCPICFYKKTGKLLINIIYYFPPIAFLLVLLLFYMML